MKNLITGISGTGKTTVLFELQKHGYAVIDLDTTGICRWKNKETQEFTEYGETGRDYEWLTQHGWYCDIDKLKQLLFSTREEKDVFVAGIAENIEELVTEFDKVFIFTAPDSIVKERLDARTNNHFAKKEEEQNFVLEHSKELLKKIKDFMEVDASRSPSEIAESLLNSL
jgi:broad-specificity NMP kinase